MKIIIAGGRDFKDYDLLCRKADKILSRQHEVEVVSGTAKGADKLGERYADERGYAIKRFPADWGTHGRKGGAIRNEDMAIYADGLILFWNGMSRGSRHMLEIATVMKLKTRVIYY